MTFMQGTLWESVVRVSERALQTGAQLPIPTEQTFIEDGGVRFFVRVLSGLIRKDEARRKQEAAEAAGRQVNPFLPYDSDLFVAEISGTHVAVLNKFNVVQHHLLIITRRYEDQETLLTPADFDALWLCMAEYESLGFYNGGREAGASQGHKHLQVVPLPLAPEGPGVPVEPLLAAARVGKGDPGTVPGLPFLHAFVRLGKDCSKFPAKAAEETFTLYGLMLRSLRMKAPGRESLEYQSMPYCFLVTREWMLLVPRSREHYEDISLNSLAFAGSFFVINEGQLARLRSCGPMEALKGVALPKERPIHP